MALVFVLVLLCLSQSTQSANERGGRTEMPKPKEASDVDVLLKIIEALLGGATSGSRGGDRQSVLDVIKSEIGVTVNEMIDVETMLSNFTKSFIGNGTDFDEDVPMRDLIEMVADALIKKDEETAEEFRMMSRRMFALLSGDVETVPMMAVFSKTIQALQKAPEKTLLRYNHLFKKYFAGKVGDYERMARGDLLNVSLVLFTPEEMANIDMANILGGVVPDVGLLFNTTSMADMFQGLIGGAMVSSPLQKLVLGGGGAEGLFQEVVTWIVKALSNNNTAASQGNYSRCDIEPMIKHLRNDLPRLNANETRVAVSILTSISSMLVNTSGNASDWFTIVTKAMTMLSQAGGYDRRMFGDVTDRIRSAFTREDSFERQIFAGVIARILVAFRLDNVDPYLLLNSFRDQQGMLYRVDFDIHTSDLINDCGGAKRAFASAFHAASNALENDLAGLSPNSSNLCGDAAYFADGISSVFQNQTKSDILVAIDIFQNLTNMLTKVSSEGQLLNTVNTFFAMILKNYTNSQADNNDVILKLLPVILKLGDFPNFPFDLNGTSIERLSSLLNNLTIPDMGDNSTSPMSVIDQLLPQYIEIAKILGADTTMFQRILDSLVQLSKLTNMVNLAMLNEGDLFKYVIDRYLSAILDDHHPLQILFSSLIDIILNDLDRPIPYKYAWFLNHVFVNTFAQIVGGASRDDVVIFVYNVTESCGGLWGAVVAIANQIKANISGDVARNVSRPESYCDFYSREIGTTFLDFFNTDDYRKKLNITSPALVGLVDTLLGKPWEDSKGPARGRGFWLMVNMFSDTSDAPFRLFANIVRIVDLSRLFDPKNKMNLAHSIAKLIATLSSPSPETDQTFLALRNILGIAKRNFIRGGFNDTKQFLGTSIGLLFNDEDFNLVQSVMSVASNSSHPWYRGLFNLLNIVGDRDVEALRRVWKPWDAEAMSSLANLLKVTELFFDKSDRGSLLKDSMVLLSLMPDQQRAEATRQVVGLLLEERVGKCRSKGTNGFIVDVFVKLATALEKGEGSGKTD